MKKKITIALVLLAVVGLAVLKKSMAQSAVVINGKDAPYNAKSDGVTDDTAAIQAAVNAAYAAGGGSTGPGAQVYFPDGKYIVTSVKVRDNVTYEGQSKENTIIQRPEAPIVGGEPISITRENTAKMTTASALGLPNGSIIFFSGITQTDWSNLNNQSYIVRKIDNYSVMVFQCNPMALAPDIYAMTKGTQTQIASVRAHGLQTGDKVTFFDITQAGWTALNGNSYAITKVDDGKFTINLDSSALAEYDTTADPGKQYKNLDTTGFSADYSSSDPGLVHQPSSWIRTFTTDGVMYSGDVDSKPLVIKNMTFDGNIDKWGPNKHYEQEHAAEVFLSGNSNKAGRLVAKIDNCYFRNSVADGASVYVNVDFE